MQKAELRKLMLDQRRLLSAEEVEDRSRKIAGLFFENFPLQNIKAIHSFLPIHKNKEVNSWLIIDQIRARHPDMHIVVPVTDFKSNQLLHYRHTPETKLEVNSWGITEPVDAELFPVEEIDLVLVPLLAFDLKGHRVGYGKGYYDNFLNQCRPGTLKIGVSLFTAIAAITDVHEQDVMLDFVITPEKLYDFRQV